MTARTNRKEDMPCLVSVWQSAMSSLSNLDAMGRNIMPSSPSDFTLTGIWKRTLAAQTNDLHEEMRGRLRDAFLSMGANTVRSPASTGHALKKLLGFIADDGTLNRLTQSNISKYYVE